jgi:photosystem II stability/assembly factor-like uncharacterized protein
LVARYPAWLVLALVIASWSLASDSTVVIDKEKKPGDGMTTATFSGLKLRSIGPALTSGRVTSLAVHPKTRGIYYVGAASGGVWKTTNGGITWTPLFDNEGSYSIGYVTLDLKNPNTVWVGSGENNSQRSVGYGDGVYRSDDGGKSWKNVGLKSSEHIGKIVIDPRDSNVVYVAAQGPLWGPGGDRGLFKTTDGGKSWKNVLFISENTGVTDILIDPRNPDVLIAAAYQRRRHVWTLINGGPESALYKSTDAGANWTKLRAGLPAEEMGRIGLAMAATNPDIIYAIIEAANKKGGIFRSNDLGATWEKRNDFDQQAQYYSHIVIDPRNAERLYVMNVLMQVSDDGGRTLRPLGERSKHVDNHCLWIDPKDTDYYLCGCDGGIYESLDRAANWRFLANLPITQFYDIAVDNGYPFYSIYGGTQDNFTLGGPSRTRSQSGIINADWFVTLGGDGFHCKVDPKDPNTVYSEYQYGGLARMDRRTGESQGIQPMPGKGEPPLRWNWDSPLLISPHANTRLYFAANKIFRSDDRGNSWKAVSPDLTRQLDRDQLPVMGKMWSPDAVSKHISTSFYGNIVALTESPKKEGLLYAGTDDGLIQITENGGEEWHKIDKFPGVPDRTYVSRLLASQHDVNTVYASFDNHKNADFAPYVLRSNDAGKTWISIKGDLPANGPVLALAEDHVDPNLLFLGTEFGLYFTQNGGQKWIRLRSGLPTIPVRDLAIQKRENDLVVGTFGRGFYVLDDYSPLRGLKPESLKQEFALFPVKDALLYIQTRPLGGRGKAEQGAAFFTAENPPFGATCTYFLKDAIKTRKQQRQEAEKKGSKTDLPSKDQLRAEEEEEAPAILLTISDATGHAVRTLIGPVTQGFQRVTWDLREPAATLAQPRARAGEDDFFPPPAGPLVMPGSYRVSVARRVDGVVTPLPGTQEFAVVVEGSSSLSLAEQKSLSEFQQKVTRLQRAVSGSLEVANSVTTRLEQIKRALDQTPSAEQKWKDVARALDRRNREILRALRGDSILRARNENTPESISERVGYIVGTQRMSLSPPTKTQIDCYQIAGQEFTEELAKLRTLVEVDLRALEKHLDATGAPWTPGRLPEWR